jgi:dephospho-CoA kinase
MSLRVGLTGGLASGKTTVADMFAARGAYVMSADKAGHELMAFGEPVYEEVITRFGKAILNENGSINRARLAEIAFGSGRIEELNRIIHPAVIAKMERWLRETSEFDPRGILMVEAALILEAGLGKYFDKLVVVNSDSKQKLERSTARTLGTGAHGEHERLQALQDAERRVGAQLSDQEKLAAADYVIDNSGSLQATERQVNEVFRELQQLSLGQRYAPLS